MSNINELEKIAEVDGVSLYNDGIFMVGVKNVEGKEYICSRLNDCEDIENRVVRYLNHYIDNK